MPERRLRRAPPPADRERRRRSRRRSKRVEVNFPVACSVGGPASSYVATNISEGGVSLRGSRPLGKGSETKLEFLLPCTGNLVRCRGEIRHLEEDGKAWMNVMFTGLEPQDRQCIESYVRDILRPTEMPLDVY